MHGNVQSFHARTGSKVGIEADHFLQAYFTKCPRKSPSFGRSDIDMMGGRGGPFRQKLSFGFSFEILCACAMRCRERAFPTREGGVRRQIWITLKNLLSHTDLPFLFQREWENMLTTKSLARDIRVCLKGSVRFLLLKGSSRELERPRETSSGRKWQLFLC